ncbi:MAG: protein kinase [Myxococcales bacterium]|nr:protein kinase [Myxococcales bacterium]
MSTRVTDLVGRELAGFRLTDFLGEGGMAAVYRGENKLTRSIVRAIKVVRTELVEQPEFVERFAREAEVLERLRHPNIVAFFGLRESELLGTRVLFMELEFLDGMSLAAATTEHAQRGGASVAWAVSCVARAADGVAAAHDLGIVHRDLKPDNIFLCRNGDVKVLDFGIAKVVGEMDEGKRLTTVGTIAGTVAYLAPEVCNGASPDARADVYALGVTLIELLLGHHPYEAPGATRKSTTQLMMAHVSQAMPSVRAVRSDVSPKLEAILARATAKDPTARFDSARDLSRALRELVPDLESALETAPKSKLETEFAIPTLRNAVTTETGRTMDVPTGPAASRSRKLRVALLGGTLALGSVAALAATGVFGESTSDASEAPVVAVVDAGPEDAAIEEPTSLANPWIRVDGARSRTVLGVGDDPPRGAVGFRADRGVVAPSGAFEIQQHEVTWSELEPFLATPEATQHRFDLPSTVPESPEDRTNLPAVGVPWNTARAYCMSLGGSLPTEEQWEYAGRGPELRPYPWGNSPVDRMRTNVYAGDEATPLAVMRSDQDVTPTGIYDLLGNAREWTVDVYRDDAPGQDESWAAEGDTTYRAVRGLRYAAPANTRVPSVGLAARDALCATGGCVEAAQAELSHIGFRCSRAVR